MPRRPRSYWVHRGSRLQPVSMLGQAVFETVPRTLSYSVHPLVLFPLQSSCSFVPARAVFRPPSTTCRSSSPLCDVTGSIHPIALGSTPRYGPPSGFLNLSTVRATSDFASLFHPAATSRVHPFRGFPLHTASPTHRLTSAPVPLFELLRS
jgi:hypothetical protein